MPKNIVLCADGTGKSDDGVAESNVARLCSVLDLRDPARQICAYDAGVGTVPRPNVTRFLAGAHRLQDGRGPGPGMPRPLKQAFGLGFGYGLRQNVEQLYGFLVANYAEGDAIYLFGFSRGAFTVRVVAGLLWRCGLLRADALSRFREGFALYEPHYEAFSDPSSLEIHQRKVADFRARYSIPGQPRVTFLGIWDTVKSYGYLWPRSLPHTRHNPAVDTVRHALSIDERRSMFALTSWGGRDLDAVQGCMPREDLTEQDVREVWFAGDHSDVGGGHPNAVGLAAEPLDWMLEEAASRRLLIDETARLTLIESLRGQECRRHDVSTQPFWRASEHVPRRDLKNCPLPPTRDWTLRSTGRRDLGESRRKGEVLIHGSVPALYDESEARSLWSTHNPTFV